MDTSGIDIRRILRTVGIIYFIMVFFFCYIVFCGRKKKGFFGKINQVVWKALHPFYSCCLGCVTKMCCCSQFKVCYNYCLYKRNPFMQMFYLAIISANVVFYFILLDDKLGEYSEYIPPIAKPIGFTLVVFSYVTFFLASYTSPGYITKANVKKFLKTWKYDNVLYHEGNWCRTCKQPKPARSKHCKFLGKCVSKYDHYCPWIANTVGEHNYRWFWLFLITNFVTVSYGAIVYITYMYAVVVKNDLLNASFTDHLGRKLPSNTGLMLQYIFNHYIFVIAQGIMLIALTLMLLFFQGFHAIKILFPNTTTNETFKWQDLKTQLNYIKKNPENFPQSSYLSDKQIDACCAIYQKGGKIVNPYTKGLIGNIKEMLFPPSLQKDDSETKESKKNK